MDKKPARSWAATATIIGALITAAAAILAAFIQRPSDHQTKTPAVVEVKPTTTAPIPAPTTTPPEPVVPSPSAPSPNRPVADKNLADNSTNGRREVTLTQPTALVLSDDLTIALKKIGRNGADFLINGSQYSLSKPGRRIEMKTTSNRKCVFDILSYSEFNAKPQTARVNFVCEK